MRTRTVQTLRALMLSFSVLLLAQGCATEAATRVVTKTEVIEVPVEVIKPLPAAIVRPTPYPPSLEDGYTVEDIVNLAFALYDALDEANADKARAGELTQPEIVEPVPQ